MRRLPHWILVAACVACSGKDETGGDSAATTTAETGPDTDTHVDTEPACSGASPVIANVVVTNNGLYDNGDGPLPSLLFAIDATDTDGDLHEISYQLWYDTTLDDAVDTAVVATLAGSTSGTTAECEATSLTLNLTVTLGGDDIPYDTPTEFAIEVADAAGYRSAPFVLEATTPKADGSDGG